MKNFKRFFLLLRKSQLTGFFAFIVLCACQPQPADSDKILMQQAQTDASAAFSLAGRRLAAAEYQSALHWFRQAAVLGNTGALEHALQLQQRLEGKLATAMWLQQQTDTTLPVAGLSASRLASLGLWQLAGESATSSAYHSTEGCAVTLQPVAVYAQGVANWEVLLQQWQADPQLSRLPVCYLPLQTVESTELVCTEVSGQRIRCQYQVLNELVARGNFSQLVVIAGNGIASYNNGIIQLPEQAGLSLLRHEFMHVLGFIDEYPLPAYVAADVCSESIIRPNLIMGTAPEVLERYLSYWQLQENQIMLTAVDTCDTQNIQAYRVVAETNLMRFYETPLPSLYFELMQKVLLKPQQIMPVQYYFAYLARQRQDWNAWQQFMQHAAEQGYADAERALARE
ncbi:hypothetical protein QE250_02235 [Chromatiaceae bacterium AAb-1]|nr:hypothetical protein [Chromatiaceae bacterium AAb-1]